MKVGVELNAISFKDRKKNLREITIKYGRMAVFIRRNSAEI
jgi:hypothetical protein